MPNICLWSGPRNVSTALMYAFAQRSDTEVLDEPLYGHYLYVSGADHPGKETVLATMDTDGERVVREVVLARRERPVRFMKQMAHHLVDLDWDFLRQTTNILLIRDPVEMLPSLVNQLPQPTLCDTGLALQSKLLRTLRAWGQTPPILESRELLLDPPGVLRRLCEQLAIPFDEGMLHWPAGPRPEDGVWAKHWYHNLHRSTGFQPYRPKKEPFPARLRPLLKECRPHYEFLYASAIKAGDE